MSNSSSQKHIREIDRRLLEAGFELLGRSMGKHWRVRVRRNGIDATLTVSGTPENADHAIVNTIKLAMRATHGG